MYGILPYLHYMKTNQNDEPARNARLEARVPQAVHTTLKRAAELEGRTLTDFVVSAALSAARNTIEQTEIIRLSRADAEAFAASLIDPPEISPAMAKAFDHHKRLFGGA